MAFPTSYPLLPLTLAVEIIAQKPKNSPFCLSKVSFFFFLVSNTKSYFGCSCFNSISSHQHQAQFAENDA